MIRVPLFLVLYNFPLPRRSPRVTSREHSVAPFRLSALIYGAVKEQEIVFALAPSVVCPRRFYESSIVSAETNERCQFSANASLHSLHRSVTTLTNRVVHFTYVLRSQSEITIVEIILRKFFGIMWICIIVSKVFQIDVFFFFQVFVCLEDSIKSTIYRRPRM